MEWKPVDATAIPEGDVQPPPGEAAPPPSQQPQQQPPEPEPEPPASPFVTHVTEEQLATSTASLLAGTDASAAFVPIIGGPTSGSGGAVDDGAARDVETRVAISKMEDELEQLRSKLAKEKAKSSKLRSASKKSARSATLMRLALHKKGEMKKKASKARKLKRWEEQARQEQAEREAASATMMARRRQAKSEDDGGAAATLLSDSKGVPYSIYGLRPSSSSASIKGASGVGKHFEPVLQGQQQTQQLAGQVEKEEGGGSMTAGGRRAWIVV